MVQKRCPNVQNDITLKAASHVSRIWKGPIAYLVLLTNSINLHKPMSVPYIVTCLYNMFSIAAAFAVARVYTGIYIYIIYTYLFIYSYATLW